MKSKATQIHLTIQTIGLKGKMLELVYFQATVTGAFLYTYLQSNG